MAKTVVSGHMDLDFRVEHLSSHGRAGSQTGGLGDSVRLDGRHCIVLHSKELHTPNAATPHSGGLECLAND